MKRIALAFLLLAQPVWAGSGDEKVKVCVTIVQAVDWSRWEGHYSLEQTVASFQEWAGKADRQKTSMRYPWYVPAVLTIIDLGYELDRDKFRAAGVNRCLEVAASEI